MLNWYGLIVTKEDSNVLAQDHAIKEKLKSRNMQGT